MGFEFLFEHRLWDIAERKGRVLESTFVLPLIGEATKFCTRQRSNKPYLPALVGTGTQLSQSRL